MDEAVRRLLLADELKQLEVLNRRRQDCHDAGLRAVLGDIHRRRKARLARLLAGPKESGGGKVEAEPATAIGAVSQPATSAEGVPVLESRLLTPDLIRFTLPRPEDFSFRAGQSVKLELDGIRRSYSIVSAPHEEVLEFFVELVPGGQMSERLRRLQPGDRVGLGTAKGGLSFDASYPHHLMIATVTGINPFISILRDYLHQGPGGHHFHILHGASYQTEFGYRDELEAIAARQPELLTYLPTVSRPEEPANRGWQGSQGRVDAIVESYRQETGLQPDSTLIYACGHSGMLDAVTQRYRPQGFQIVTENYD